MQDAAEQPENGLLHTPDDCLRETSGKAATIVHTMFFDLRLLVCFTGTAALPLVSTPARALANDVRSSMGEDAAAAAALA